MAEREVGSIELDATDIDAITFDAVVWKVQTLADSGLRVTFDLPETAIAQAAKLMECKRNETALRVAVAKSDGLIE